MSSEVDAAYRERARLVAVLAAIWPSVITFLQWSDFIRRDANDCEMLDTRTLATHPEPQTAVWSLPFAPHSVENVGDTELRTISVELKEERRG